MASAMMAAFGRVALRRTGTFVPSVAVNAVPVRTFMLGAGAAPSPLAVLAARRTLPTLGRSGTGFAPAAVAQTPAMAAPAGARAMGTFGQEYQPSQIKRKRRHGFMARLRSKTGRRILKNRRLKGRKFLSH